MSAQPEQYVVLQQAASWYARLGAETVTALDRQKWQVWFDQRPEHRNAWALVEKVGGRFATFQEPGDKAGAFKALQSAVAPPMSRRQTLLGLSVLALGGALGWRALNDGSLGDGVSSLWADYRTDTGQTRNVNLADGSQVWLNTDSAINIAISAEARHVHLLKGEVLFEATPPSARQTVVRTRQGQAIASNAVFSTRLLDDVTCVTVYSGQLQVLTGNQHCSAAAGQQVRFASGKLGPVEPAQTASRSWTKGILVAENMTLGHFISELSRYRQGYLGCDPQVANLRVLGTFSIKDTDRALSALASALPVTIHRTLPWWVTVQARA
jgi:transmembrane sensor